jgi:hypothetical protein
MLQQLPSSQLSFELARPLSLPYFSFFQLSFFLSLCQLQTSLLFVFSIPKWKEAFTV